MSSSTPKNHLFKTWKHKMIETVLSWIDIVAERRIVDAMNEGVFDNLPGKGKPLNLEDDLSVPAHLRIQAKILKNAGGVPEWIQIEKEWLRERNDSAGASFSRTLWDTGCCTSPDDQALRTNAGTTQTPEYTAAQVQRMHATTDP
jgi:hypothetical protein